MTKRCSWVKVTNPLYIAYHDEEWGQPLHDDQALFELLCMETYQAGLSWETVLNKRQAFTILLVLDPFLRRMLVYDVEPISPLGKEIGSMHLPEKFQLWKA